jgi:molecular chaperone GrpE (heat shock protein)
VAIGVLEGLKGLLSGNSKWVAPAFALTAAAPALGYILQRRNEDRELRERLAREQLERMYGVTGPTARPMEDSIDNARLALKTALDKSAELREGLDLLRDTLRAAKERARACP